jgi:hypothetical protein
VERAEILSVLARTISPGNRQIRIAGRFWLLRVANNENSRVSWSYVAVWADCVHKLPHALKRASDKGLIGQLCINLFEL